jgi:protocatechuate 3,4-dioxygenase alpha subunit
MIEPFMGRQPEHLTATPSQTVGPFFHFGLTQHPSLGTMAGPGVPGEHIRLHVSVIDGDGQPVPDALVELWQADAQGQYSSPAFSGFGRLPTTSEGSCVFETIRPGLVRHESGRFQASHINVCLFARGLLRQLYTRIYFAGDDRLKDDVVLAAIPEERRTTLLAVPVAGGTGEWRFDIRLQGAGETVFLDL